MSDRTKNLKIKVWITKYALTTGVIETDAEVCTSVGNTMIFTLNSFHNINYFHKPEWHETKESAANHVLEMICKQRRSLDKKLLKLQKLEIKLRKEGLDALIDSDQTNQQ